MRFSFELVPKDPFWKLELLGRIIEEIGGDGIWVSEHPSNRSSILVTAYLLERLPKPWIGIGVLNPYMFSPLTAAQVAATLSELAPGRVLLGIGAGDKVALSSAGIEREKPLKRVEAMVKAARALLEKRSFKGYGLDAKLDFRPRSRVPIYLGAQGERMLRLAGRIGDGVLINHSRPEPLGEAIKEVMEGLREAGRRAEDMDIGAYLTISIHEDRKKALKTAAPYSAHIICGAGRKFLEEIGVDEGKLKEIEKVIASRDWIKLYEILPESYIEATAFIGKADQLRELVIELRELGYTQIVFGAPLGPRVLKALRWIGEIISEMRRDL